MTQTTGENVSTSSRAPAPDAIAAAFVVARREARALADYPGPKPATMAEAYAIQNRALALDGRRVAGWKVGRIGPPADAQFGANRLTGPVFADSLCYAEAGTSTAMPVYVGGFAAVEGEFLLHVAPGYQGPLPQDDAATLALLDEVRIGIEIASSPYAGINEDGPPVTVSDFGNNMGLILGTPIADWRHRDLNAIEVVAEVDGREVGRASTATMLDGPLGAVRFLLANLAERGIDASGGLWVSSGAITGVHEVSPGQGARVHFEGLGHIACHFHPAAPRA